MLVQALRVPADPVEPLAVVRVKPSATALSEAIGGGLLDDSVQGWTAGDGYTFYLDENRVRKGLPDNARAATLAARLGHTDRIWLSEVRGDVLITGCTLRGDETDVPEAVLAAAHQAGLTVAVAVAVTAGSQSSRR